ncbi:MAG TPA: two-component regulator propeller domain-containing protein, partial [Steroidobacteraceae bacterium]|nr:two-component regulator propeller domain-containing protein [Steroidobacteraceae bacterium]
MIEMLHFLSNAGSDAGARLRACLFACLCLAFVAAAPAQQISLRQYAQGDGLLNLSIHQMLVDPAGDIWVATDGGLFRFDGTRFDGYDRSRGIPAGAVNSIAQSPSGRIVARMDEGLYIGGAGGFELLRTATGPVQSDEYTSLVATRDDTVFFVRGQQLYVAQQTSVPGRWQVRPVFNANTLARFPDLARVAGVTATAAGAVWFGCGMGICSYADGGVAFWDGSRGVLPGEYNELLATHGGRLWARSADHIVVRDPGAQQFVLRDPPGGALVNGVNRPLLVADAMSRVVTRTATGLARWQGAQWQTFSRADGLPEQTITSAVADRDGGFWLGAAGVGMFRWLGYDNLESWTQAQGLKQGSVWFMLRDDQHRLILGTDAGCQMLDESARRVVPCPFRGLPVEQASTGARGPDGSLWFAFQYSGQLWRVPPGSVQAERYQGLPANFKPNFMLFDHRDGNAWIAAKEHGVVRMDGRTHRLQFIVPPDGARVNDFTVNFDGSTLWLATSAGLFRYRGGQFLRIATDADGIGSSVATVETRFDG